MQTLFTKSEKIKLEIEHVLEQFYVEDGHFPLSREFYWHMKKYATSGKLFRGCFLSEMYTTLQSSRADQMAVHSENALLRIAAGLELICSGLLVHDDIMDHDARRRGLLTTHTTMADWAETQEFALPTEFGESAALCFGDVLFFLGSDCFSQAEVPAEVKVQLQHVSNHELMLLGLAQAEDLRLANMQIEAVSEDEIIKMQYGKTGRYTGRWPLVLAATLVGVSAQQTEKLGRIGDELGLLYQWRDDYLGLFGDPQKTGKNVVSDIQEGKKTLYYWHAWHSLEGAEKQVIESAFGNPHVSVDAVSQVLDILENSGVVDRIEEKIDTQIEKTKERIHKANLPDAAEELLLGVVELIVKREK